MAFKYSKGSQVIGDLKAADDTQRDTLIDFGEDRIDLQTSGSTRLKISGSDGAITFNEQYTFPTADGSANQVLQTNGSGQLSFANAAGGGGGSSPGGPDGAVQINDGGSLTGSAGFTYDGTEIYASASVAIVGDQRLHDPDFASDNERKRSFTYKSHRHFRLIPANNWTDVISWRPYKTGTTTDPEANSFYAVVGFRLEIHGSTGGVGAGSKSRVGYVAYNGSSANSANAADTSLGNPVSTRVNMSGWTTNLQINPNQSGASSFTGVVYVEVYFTRGEGSNGNNIEWSIT